MTYSYLLLFFCCCVFDWTSSIPIKVNTDKGPVVGFTDSTGVVTFLGVPYASPPLGSLRWKVPQPHDPWTDAWDATQYANPCIQPMNSQIISSYTFPSNVTVSEDCLYLNIWVPPNATSTNPKSVMFWIHGGGLVQGGNSEYRLHGNHMALMGDVIVVVINYRLGVMGWLGHSAFSKDDPNRPTTGNYGLLDQRSALAWVKSNIAFFGGNPNQVTIFGESAGGSSVSFHLGAPKSKGLYSQAIIESGAGFAEMTSLKVANQVAVTFQLQLGCKSDSVSQILECMRQATAQEVLNIQVKLRLPASAVVDYFEFSSHLYQTVKQSKLNVVPLISGNVLDEGSLFISSPPITYTNYMKSLEISYGSYAPLIAEQYPCQSSDCWSALKTLTGDSELICPNILIANSIATAQPNTYTYVYTHMPLWGNQTFPGKGVFHSSEIAFVFSTLEDVYPYTNAEKTLATQMTKYWTNFGKQSSPDSDGVPLNWPQYTTATYERMKLDESYSIINSYNNQSCTFWSTLYDLFYTY